MRFLLRVALLLILVDSVEIGPCETPPVVGTFDHIVESASGGYLIRTEQGDTLFVDWGRSLQLRKGCVIRDWYATW